LGLIEHGACSPVRVFPSASTRGLRFANWYRLDFWKGVLQRLAVAQRAMSHSYRGYDSDDRLSSSSDETLRPETSNSNGPTTQILTSAKTQSTLDEFDFAALVRSVLDR
jgi:hypothetical protein